MFLSEKLGSIILLRNIEIVTRKDFYVCEYMDHLNQLEKNRKGDSIFFNRIADKNYDQIVEVKKAFKMKKMKNTMI